ncbi:MAG: adenylate kinase [Candidatus Bilamarchaeaceae archaeon]
MIIVMGLPGAGKSTVLEKAKGEYSVLNYGTLLLEIWKKEYGITDRDQIRVQPVEKQREAQKAVGKFLGKQKGKVILDTHCSILTPSGYLPGLPFDVLGLIKVDGLVMITGDPDEIAQRRSNDPTRQRKADPEEIREHDGINRSFLAAYSAFSGAPAKIIMNRNGKLDDAVTELKTILK